MTLDVQTLGAASYAYRVRADDGSRERFEQALANHQESLQLGSGSHDHGEHPSAQSASQKSRHQPANHPQTADDVSPVQPTNESEHPLHTGKALETEDEPSGVVPGSSQWPTPVDVHGVKGATGSEDGEDVVAASDRATRVLDGLTALGSGGVHARPGSDVAHSPPSEQQRDQPTALEHLHQLFTFESQQARTTVTTAPELISLVGPGSGATRPASWGGKAERDRDQAVLSMPGVPALDATYRLTMQAVLPASPVAVAEQIQHWMVRDVQQAQLSLQGLGQEPVQVAISVQGQSAQVFFATDNPQARQLIQASLQELSVLMASDGLVLTGAHVGTSAHRQPHPQTSQSGWVQHRVSRSQVLATDAVPLSMPSSRRGGLDLYV